MQLRFRRINLLDNIEAKVLADAQKDASKHSKGVLKHLPYTESHPEWTLLYNHARVGQITPDTMHYMKRIDLYYLAGMTFPHPALTQPHKRGEEMPGVVTAEMRWDELTKLQGNVERAHNELRRRNFIWAGTFTVLGAALAALVGGYMATV